MKAAEEALDGKRQVASTAMMAFKKERHEKLTKELAAAEQRVREVEREVRRGVAWGNSFMGPHGGHVG